MKDEIGGVQIVKCYVPFLDVQIEKHPGYPSLTMDEMVTAVEACLQAIIDSYGN